MKSKKCLIQSPISEINADADALVRMGYLLGRDDSSNNSCDKDMLEELVDAAYNQKPRSITAKSANLRNAIFSDNLRICIYRQGIKSIIEGINSGLFKLEVIALLEKLLDETRDGIPQLDD